MRPNSGRPAQAPSLPDRGSGAGVCWLSVAPQGCRHGACLLEVSASPSCPVEEPTVAWVSCSLVFVSYFFRTPPREGRGLHVLLACVFWAFVLWATWVGNFLSGQKRENCYSLDPTKLKKVVTRCEYPNTFPWCSLPPVWVCQTHGACRCDVSATIVELVRKVCIFSACAVPRAASECLCSAQPILGDTYNEGRKSTLIALCHALGGILWRFIIVREWQSIL